MSFPTPQRLYTVGSGTTAKQVPIFEERDPTSTDIGPPWPIQQTWVNTLTQAIWVLETFSSSQGVVSAQWRALAPIVTSTVAPTSSDYQYPIGQLWLNTSTDLGYILIDVTSEVATWDEFAGHGIGVESFTVPAGTSPVVPDASGGIDLPAGNGFQFTGGTNAMTGAMLSPFTGDFVFTGRLTAEFFETEATDAGATLTGNSLIADGTDTNIDVVITPKGTGVISTTKAASGQWLAFNDGTDAFGYYNNAGSPEGVVTASIGSLCPDTTNGVLYVKNTGDATNTGWVEIDAGGGDVVGPASATDNAFVRFNGTTGKLIKDSNLIALTNNSYDISSSNPGNSVQFSIKNSDDTNAASQTALFLQSGATNGDPFTAYIINGGTSTQWCTGFDNSDGDAFKININPSGAVSPSLGNNTVKITTAGEMTKPLQPAFLATMAATQTDVTGGGTAVTANFTTEVFDQNNDYDGTNTFTAPVTGRYLFTAEVLCTQLAADMTGSVIRIITSNRNYQNNCGNAGAIKDTSNNLTLHNAVIADMDANDTCTIQVQISSGSADDVDLGGEATGQYFSGALVC